MRSPCRQYVKNLDKRSQQRYTLNDNCKETFMKVFLEKLSDIAFRPFRTQNNEQFKQRFRISHSFSLFYSNDVYTYI